jgi:hypothetical protein
MDCEREDSSRILCLARFRLSFARYGEQSEIQETFAFMGGPQHFSQLNFHFLSMNLVMDSFTRSPAFLVLT